VTVFTSNQPRHLALIAKLAAVADTVHAVIECNTVFPGRVEDFFKKSPVMQRYLSQVMTAEQEIFGSLTFLPANVKTLSLKLGDLSMLDREPLSSALESDIYVVFGSSFIRGWLVEELVANRAVNIHMGLSPYYRGSSCNFWALHDRRPAFVGATIHYLSAGLDSGPILAHVRPEFTGQGPFNFTMQSVESVQNRLVSDLMAGTLLAQSGVPQDKALELRYSRNADFDDRIASHFLENLPSPDELSGLLNGAEQPTDLL
jgi:folate-dependent phosphoribosylglycinamide formyltransferase PurN